jgi:hypothetical protein
MQTSYFAISSGIPNAVSIAAKAPEFFIGKEYLPLAPTWKIFSDYKLNKNKNLYIERYVEEILFPLNPEEIYKELQYSILLCWETPDKFCHRRIVAKWLEDSLKIKVPEL